MGATATIVGSKHRERIHGTPHRDVIDARSGNDVIIGNGGGDRICGGPRRDSITGGVDSDRLEGGSGMTGSRRRTATISWSGTTAISPGARGQGPATITSGVPAARI
jgi:Ca2+-binding RTX toxin-like protein